MVVAQVTAPRPGDEAMERLPLAVRRLSRLESSFGALVYMCTRMGCVYDRCRSIAWGRGWEALKR